MIVLYPSFVQHLKPCKNWFIGRCCLSGDSQSGYRRMNGTLSAVHEEVKDLKSALNRQKVTATLFLDLKRFLMLFSTKSYLGNYNSSDSNPVFH